MASKEEMKAMGIKVMQCKECCRDITEEEYKKNGGFCKKCYSNKDEYNAQKSEYNGTSKNFSDEENKKNKVAFKFLIVINFMKLLGYGSTIIGFIALLSNEETGFAFLCLICGSIGTWLSTLFFEAVAEGLQLLQDIKDKI